VLRLQQGTCFEYSTLLVCLLAGVGYDAYVVSGYATKEICLMDETRETCPLMKPVPEVGYIVGGSTLQCRPPAIYLIYYTATINVPVSLHCVDKNAAREFLA